MNTALKSFPHNEGNMSEMYLFIKEGEALSAFSLFQIGNPILGESLWIKKESPCKACPMMSIIVAGLGVGTLCAAKLNL